MKHLVTTSALVSTLLLGALTGSASAQPHEQITYVLPHWFGYSTVSDSAFAAEVNQLRSRIGEGPYVRVGFTVFVYFLLDDYNPNPTSAAAAMEPLVAQIDAILARARKHGIPVCLSFLTAIRSEYDQAQRESERRDRRVMQWHSDNSMASGWWTHSRYARFQRRVREAYVKELGRIVANRMARFPDTLVAVSGDAEVELSFDESLIVNPALDPQTSRLADYSPFAVAEFRDWLRHDGLYAPGESFSGQGYVQGHRYRGDATPAVDTNGDGHTLNGDFGTTFDSWNLRYFDWSLTDNPNIDPRAIPDSVYQSAGFNPLPDAGASRFDAPRSLAVDTPFAAVWRRFREIMIWRHNLDFAEWMTTSQDPATGSTVPTTRFYSDQIPADYLFGSSPTNPNYRLTTSASPHWTADVTPYGALGVTAFNFVIGNQFFPTLRNVAPAIASRNVRWGLFEYNAAVPATTDLALYRADMSVLEQTRPSLIVPVYWDDNVAPYFFKDTGFETALRELVDRIKNSPVPAPAGPSAPTPPPGPGTGDPGGVPGAPTGLSAAVNGLAVTFNWLPPAALFAPDPRAPAASFVLEVGTASGLADLAMLPVGSGTTFAAVGTPGTYVVAVRGVNATGPGPRSNEVVVSLPGGGGVCPSVPGAPGDLSASVIGRTVTLSWNASTGCAATSYVIEAGSSSGAANLANLDTATPGTVFVAQDVGPGTYHVRVRGRNTHGSGPVSNEIVVLVL